MEDGVDQGKVGEGLREVAKVLATVWVDLLAVELEGSRKRKQLGAELPRLVELPDLAQGRAHPEPADGEGAPPALKPVIGFRDLVAEYQAVHGQLVADGQHRRADAWVVGGEEA